jgi:hypothetical protein
MKIKKIFLALGILALIVFGIAQIPTILPVSPVTEFVDFLKGMKSSGPFEVGSLGRNLKTRWGFNDFLTNDGLETWKFLGSGTGNSSFPQGGTALRPGIQRLYTGTDTTGLASIYCSSSANFVLFGGGIYIIEGDINIATLSDGTNTYYLRFGFGDVYNADFVDGAYFEYYSPTSANWYKCTASNSTRTKTDTTIAAAAAAWTRLKIVVNSAGTSVEYFINGISVGVVTTNIPTGTGRETGVFIQIIKTAGTTGRTIDVDWTWLHVDLTTSR